MKKRIWIVALGVPIVLASTILWLRHLEWLRLENKVRQDIQERAMGKIWGPPEGLSLLIQEQYHGIQGPGQFVRIEPNQTATIVSKIHLANTSMKDASDSGALGKFSRFGVVISRQHHRAPDVALVFFLTWPGHIIDGPPGSEEADLSGLQLTPESCRSINSYIRVKYGAKLRALHIPPPQ